MRSFFCVFGKVLLHLYVSYVYMEKGRKVCTEPVEVLALSSFSLHEGAQKLESQYVASIF